jgi:EAL domain-containing protein (putative c-di-GMP-specific phosphodiesterase class I)
LPSTIAFNGHTLSSAFQPIYGVREGKAIGYEGLVRATNAAGEAVRANRLFEGLDDAETISLDRTCRTLHMRSFASLDPGKRMLFLNVNPVAAVAEAENVRAVRSRIGYFGLTPERVCIEILEGACDDEGQLVDAIAAYREMGLAIAMDDFGVARSNFDRVASLRPDYVKLDRSLLTDAIGDAKARRTLPCVITILHATGTKVVIEGIETASEALVAIESGADILQGYYFATPTAHLHDDALTERILRELVRMPAAAARRSPPTGDSLHSYRAPPLETVE